MATPSLPNQNVLDSRQSQNTFDIYVLGLTFTILGLSLQTATFGVEVAADIMELVAWGALLISGLTGLYRGQWKPQLYFAFALKETSNKASNEDLDNETKSIQQKILRSFEIQRSSFILGLLSLIIARGYEPAIGIVTALKSLSN